MSACYLVSQALVMCLLLEFSQLEAHLSDLLTRLSRCHSLQPRDTQWKASA
jgi:hypothetical protein